jgi:hypothetical protein
MKRFSIAWLMTIVLFLAVDIGLVRAAYGRNFAGRSSGYLAIVLPMVNVLLMVFPRVNRSHPNRWFWRGFELVGWVVILILGFMDRKAKGTLFIPYWWYRSFQLYPPESVTDLMIVYSSFVVLYTPPQLLLAWLGGRIVDFPFKYRIRIDRR